MTNSHIYIIKYTVIILNRQFYTDVKKCDSLIYLSHFLLLFPFLISDKFKERHNNKNH